MIIDCHTHFNNLTHYDAMIADQRRTGCDQFNILVFEKLTSTPDSLKMPHALWFKHKHPERVYVFGGLDCTGMCGPDSVPEVSFAAQIQSLIDSGCDGLKMLLGKPDQRKRLGQPLSAPVFVPMFELLEKTGFPVLWHVGDPPEFWYPDRVPLWAKQNKWWYDETFPPKSVIDAEIAAVIKRHPRLNLILPHSFFMSDDVDAAAAFLRAHPNIVFDLAPGVEMYHNYTRQRARAREFFIEHAHQILFGTDIGIGAHETGPRRGWMIRHFLESDEKFQVPDDPFMTPDPRPDLHGLKLPKDALEKIYAANFQRILRAKGPRPLNMPIVKSLLNDWESLSIRRGEGPSTAGRVLKELN
jgi:predicted TIM-barrel fold metal-dependent hydrolase